MVVSTGKLEDVYETVRSLLEGIEREEYGEKREIIDGLMLMMKGGADEGLGCTRRSAIYWSIQCRMTR